MITHMTRGHDRGWKRNLIACGLLLLSLPLQAQVVQWGEAPSGVNTRGTNIIVPPNKNIVFVNREELLSYSGITNNPGVGGTNYYWDAVGRAPYFSAACSDNSLGINPVLTVEQANSGDRIIIYGGNVAPGGTYRGMVMWPFNVYFSPTGQAVSVSSVSLAINQRINASTTNQQVRVVVEEGGSFYITEAAGFGASFTTQHFVFASQTWRNFIPFTNGTETIGGIVSTPPLVNLQSVGYYFSAQNGGSSNSAIGAQVQYFNASGTVVAIPMLTGWTLLLLAGLLGYLGYQRLRLSPDSR